MSFDNVTPDAKADQQDKSSGTFTFRYLGCSSLVPNKTGFGAVQGALRDLYIPFITRADSQCRQRNLILREDGLTMVHWDLKSGKFQEDFYPYDFVTYVDYVKFGLTKGKKRYFGYFRRYRDRNDTLPDSILVPIERKHKFITKMNHLPLIVCVLRRPKGVRFLDCHVLQADCQNDARVFYEIVEMRTNRRPGGPPSAVTAIDNLKFHDQIPHARHPWVSQPKLNSWDGGEDLPSRKSPEAAEAMPSYIERSLSVTQGNSRVPFSRRRQISSGSGNTLTLSTGASLSSDDSAFTPDRPLSNVFESDDPRDALQRQLESRLSRTKSDTNIFEGVSSYLIAFDVEEDYETSTEPDSQNPQTGKVSRLISKFESESPPISPTRAKPVAMIKPNRRASDSNHLHEYKLSDRNSPRRVKRDTLNRKEQLPSSDEESKEALLRHTQRAKVVKSAEIKGDVFAMNLRRQDDFQTALGYLP